MVLLKLPPLPAICINLLRTCVRILDFSPATVWYFGYSGHNIWCYGFLYTHKHITYEVNRTNCFNIPYSLCLPLLPVRHSIHTANVLCAHRAPAQKSDENFCCIERLAASFHGKHGNRIFNKTCVCVCRLGWRLSVIESVPRKLEICAICIVCSK